MPEYIGSIQMFTKESKSHGFLLKTYDMLENGKHKEIIDWGPEGKGFIIYDLQQLQARVLPYYFKHSNFQSFVRQLNMYGFHKIRSTKDTNYYTHDLFCRDERENVKVISRKVEKKMIKKGKHNEDEMQRGELKETNQVKQKEDVECSPSLLDLMRSNKDMLQEQHYLVETLKQQWQQMESILTIGLEGVPEELRETDCSNEMYLQEQEKARHSLECYWSTQQQMFSKLYLQSVSVIHSECEMPATGTSFRRG